MNRHGQQPVIRVLNASSVAGTEGVVADECSYILNGLVPGPFIAITYRGACLQAVTFLCKCFQTCTPSFLPFCGLNADLLLSSDEAFVITVDLHCDK